MTTSNTSPFLRRVLLADAATSGASGLLMTLGSGPLGDLLGVPPPLLRYAGLSLLPFAALVAYLATRERLPRPAVWAVIALNALWAADSILLLVGGWVGPTALGYAFIVAQALVVAAFAEAQYIGLRKSHAAA
ncbi:MAG: hypothetical protein M3416_21030 [Acidobacteriota bacterium]|nr:hypothetical protein [Acidobacteriota bacterium]